MTQESESGATGSDLDGGVTVAERSADPNFIPDSVRASMAPQLLATLPEAKAEPDGEDSTGDTAETETATPEEQLTQWVTGLDENPASITSVPRAQQAAVIAAWKNEYESAAVAALQAAYAQGREHAQAQIATQSQVETLDELLEAGDVALFREQVKLFPGGEKNYYRVKAEMQPIPANSAEAFQAQADEIFAQLAPHPEAQKAFADRWDYAPTEADMRRLAIDVGKALGSIQAGRNADPAAKALAARTQAAAGRKAIPRVEVSPPNAGPGGGLPSLAALSAMTSKQIADLKLTDAQLQEVLSGTK